MPEGFLIGIPSGFVLGIMIGNSDKPGKGGANSYGSNFIVFGPYMGAVVGSAAGWLIGRNYIYKFNP